MSKARIYEIAKELNVDSKLIVEKLKEMHVDVKNHMSSITEEESARVRQAFQKPAAPKQQEKGAGESAKKERQARPNEERPKREPGNQNRNNSYRENGKKDMTQKSGQKQQNTQARPSGSENRDARPNKEQRDGKDSHNRSNSNREAGNNRDNTKENRNRDNRSSQEHKGDFKGQNRRNGQDANQNNRNNGMNGSGKKNNRDGGKDGGKDGGFRKNHQDSASNRKVGANANRAIPSAPVRQQPSKAKQAAKNNNEHFSKDAVEERYQEWSSNQSPKARPEQIARSKRNENSNFQSKSGKNNKGKNKNNKNMRKEPPREFAEVKHHVVLEDSITVQDLAYQMGKKATDVIMKLMGMGVMATINQDLDVDTATIIAEEFGATVEVKVSKEEELFTEVEDKPEDLEYRPPVVTIMGHVDHGKTSLLDKIRSTHVTSTEAGGITQHIGAYQVETHGQKITFLDTPGHEAFTAMRARGAQITDIAILVVAADDGVMPQTIEAIDHAKAANVPIIVAVNKIDKPEADPERIKQELTNYGLVPEEWGGDTIMVPVSAKKGIGIDELLDMILLVAEMGELKANPNRNAKGKVIESKLDKGRGPVATLLVQAGTLHVGDFLIVGTTQGRIRAMFDYKGRSLKSAGPSVPVEILGLNEVPEAGDDYIAVDNEKLAKQVADKRQKEKHQQEIARNTKVSLEDLFAQIKEGEIKELNIVLKADVQGSIEAIKQSLEKLGNEEVRVNIIRTAVGGIREADVMLAAASNAIIIGFNVRPDSNARKLAEKEDIQINTYRVIYEAIEDVKAALSGMLDPDIKEVELGQAEVRSIFKVPKVGTVAGCYITEGKLTRNARIRVVRDGVVIHDGNLGSLKRFKDDVKEVASGFECGLSVERFNDIKEGDILEAYTFEEVKRAL